MPKSNSIEATSSQSSHTQQFLGRPKDQIEGGKNMKEKASKWILGTKSLKFKEKLKSLLLLHYPHIIESTFL